MNILRKQLSIGVLGVTVLFSSCGGDSKDTKKDTGEKKPDVTVKKYPIEKALDILAKENDVARTLYTKGIVGPGKKAGLKFDEDWRKDDVEAGPLPALFLRGISAQIQKSDVELGLFLGSEFPINTSNKFTGKQMTLFEKIKKDTMPQFFFDEDSKMHTAMFADIAGAMPCVSCHNGHEETPKDDWKLGDIMGATTWTYPKDSVTYEEIVAMVEAYRTGAKYTLNEYAQEIEAFESSDKPVIGDKWPAEGMFVPSADVFLDSVKTLSHFETIKDKLAAN